MTSEKEFRNRIAPWVAAWLGCGFGAVSLMGERSTFSIVFSVLFFAYCIYSVFRMHRAMKELFKEMDGEDGTSDTR